MPLSAGDKFGPYTLVSRLGEGGMGEVWKARDTRLDGTVALKVCKAAFSERFELEARAVAALNHPNICTLFDVGPNYLVMEYVDGQSLASLIPAGGMRLADALKIAVRIADALAAAHARGIVHRDLKPGNVMVIGEGVVKLLDFGLAAIDESTLPTGDSVATRTAIQSPKTAAGTILGTFSYMSPEQAEGRKVDTRSDIFSFGSMLYEMVTGQRAFCGKTTISTLAAILNQEPKPPAALVAGLPVDLERIIARCLRKDRDRRFQHASDLRVELHELAEAPAPAAPVSDAPAARPSRAIWLASAVAAVPRPHPHPRHLRHRAHLRSRPLARRQTAHLCLRPRGQRLPQHLVAARRRRRSRADHP
jgi:serine/threonine protein kinase